MAVTLRDFMSSEDVLAISADTTLFEAARRMRDRNVGAAIVLEDGRLAGIFTERDLLRAVAGGRDVAGQVRHSMTPDPVTLPPDHSPSDAARLMAERHFRHVPVTDGGTVIGIVSIRDLVSAELHMPSEHAHPGSDFP